MYYGSLTCCWSVTPRLYVAGEGSPKARGRNMYFEADRSCYSVTCALGCDGAYAL